MPSKTCSGSWELKRLTLNSLERSKGWKMPIPRLFDFNGPIVSVWFQRLEKYVSKIRVKIKGFVKNNLERNFSGLYREKYALEKRRFPIFFLQFLLFKTRFMSERNGHRLQFSRDIDVICWKATRTSVLVEVWNFTLIWLFFCQLIIIIYQPVRWYLLFRGY